MDSEVRRLGLVGPLGRLCVVVVSDESGPRDGREVISFPLSEAGGTTVGSVSFFRALAGTMCQVGAD